MEERGGGGGDKKEEKARKCKMINSFFFASISSYVIHAIRHQLTLTITIEANMLFVPKLLTLALALPSRVKALVTYYGPAGCRAVHISVAG